MAREPVQPRGVREKVTSASTEELLNAPHAVAERLVAPLLRGLGIGPRYLPYKPELQRTALQLERGLGRLINSVLHPDP